MAKAIIVLADSETWSEVGVGTSIIILEESEFENLADGYLSISETSPLVHIEVSDRSFLVK